MAVSERNIINSFRLVKNDIMKLQDEIIKIVKIGESQLEIIKRLEKIKGGEIKIIERPAKPVQVKPTTKTKIITKTIIKTPKKIYVASKEGKKFHITQCPFAQNIKPKTKIVFKSKKTAFNKGYKPCKCVI